MTRPGSRARCRAGAIERTTAGGMAVLFALFALFATSACRGGGVTEATRVVTVFAAASLAEAFGAIERAFEIAHPGVDVRVNFAGSQVLAMQIEQGARADVFASADESSMQRLAAAGRVEGPQRFARNSLVVVTPLDNPAGIETFEDLHRASRIVIGAASVPAGAYTHRLLERARSTLGDPFTASVLARVVSEESNVRLVRAKVEIGEADAAIVYRTDALASARVRVVPIPAELDEPADYAIAVVTGGAQRDEARALVAYVRGDGGQRILAAHGFVTEPP